MPDAPAAPRLRWPGLPQWLRYPWRPPWRLHHRRRHHPSARHPSTWRQRCRESSGCALKARQGSVNGVAGEDGRARVFDQLQAADGGLRIAHNAHAQLARQLAAFVQHGADLVAHPRPTTATVICTVRLSLPSCVLSSAAAPPVASISAAAVRMAVAACAAKSTTSAAPANRPRGPGRPGGWQGR